LLRGAIGLAEVSSGELRDAWAALREAREVIGAGSPRRAVDEILIPAAMDNPMEPEIWLALGAVLDGKNPQLAAFMHAEAIAAGRGSNFVCAKVLRQVRENPVEYFTRFGQEPVAAWLAKLKTPPN
jgi:hypothetical protein